MSHLNELSDLARQLLDMFSDRSSGVVNAREAAQYLENTTIDSVTEAAKELSSKGFVVISQNQGDGMFVFTLTEEGRVEVEKEMEEIPRAPLRCRHCGDTFGQDRDAWRSHDCPDKPDNTMGLS